MLGEQKSQMKSISLSEIDDLRLRRSKVEKILPSEADISNLQKVGNRDEFHPKADSKNQG